MAKPELGTKRIDPETGRKFYDLNKDPIVSPYTGISYPRSFFEATTAKARPQAAVEPEEEEAEDEEAAEGAEFISLEEADDESAGPGATEDADSEDEAEIDLAEDDDATFLEEDEEEGDDVTDIIGGVDEEEP
ncbi:TIGR02300 family protein [Prosthecomicrobium pneumaticum]|uniref:Uncharacterized protein (TIGR02300 family) n=1 Tax=Prosthecomicrobium pneumaticum TaxID=81895 RepID=A0A7W9FN75_9HYPH|nr:uncharacterized protein (TIGR02300 family) [Prosthecomicrobium pneumaticum]